MASKLYQSSLVWDNHVCLPQNVDDDLLHHLDGLALAGINTAHLNIGDAQLPLEKQIRLAALYRHWLSRHKDRYLLAESVQDIRNAHCQGKVAIFFDVEGMYALGTQISLIKLYYDIGVRWIAIAYNLKNNVGGGCHDEEDNGVTEFGYKVLEEMQRVGMIIDCSHTGYKTARNVFEYVEQPVNFSHANPRALVDHPRNIPDDLIIACAKSGGVVGINGIGHFLDGANTRNMLRHIDYCAQLVGPKHVGIGTDFMFGRDKQFSMSSKKADHIWPIKYYTGNFTVAPLSVFPDIADGLLQLGYSETEVMGVLGENWLRVAEQVWK